MCVCVCVCYHFRGGIANFYTRTKLRTALSRYHGILFIFNSWILTKLRSEVMASFATSRAGSDYRCDVTIALREYSIVQVSQYYTANCAHSCSILLNRGFSEFYWSSTVSLDCRILRQVPSRLRLFSHQEYVSWSHG